MQLVDMDSVMLWQCLPSPSCVTLISTYLLVLCSVSLLNLVFIWSNVSVKHVQRTFGSSEQLLVYC